MVEEDPIGQPPLLRDFTPITEDEFKKIMLLGNSKSCMLDPIPTTLLKVSLDFLLPVLTKIVNLSLTSSEVPSKFKTAVVFPIIKKILLYKEDFKNYHPFSNLPYIGKITEKVVIKQMNSHMAVHNLHDLFQSPYRKGHSTGTALLYVYNDLLCAVDGKRCVLLLLLDLPATFDTIKHTVLLQRFQQVMGITCLALEWLKSYFSGREQLVHVEGASSCKHPLITGMPQGSVTGPFGFPTYRTPLWRICSARGVRYHLYADITFDHPDEAEAVARLEKCIADVSLWMHKNFLKSNNSKTGITVTGSKHNLKDLENVTEIGVGDTIVRCSKLVRNIGTIFD